MTDTCELHRGQLHAIPLPSSLSLIAGNVLTPFDGELIFQSQKLVLNLKVGEYVFIQQEDDKPEAVAARLRQYKDVAKPVIELYK